MDKDVGLIAHEALGVLPHAPASIGVWDWDLSSNLIFADEAVAEAFGVEARDARRGLPPEAYFSHIHAEDRQMIVDHSMRSIATLGSCSDNFRIVRLGGVKWVHSQGRCFAAGDNSPKCFVGLISEFAPTHPLDQPDAYRFSGGCANDDVLYLCLHAKRIAMRSNRPFLTYLLEMVISEVTEAKVVYKS